jgi:molybdenum cofactor cytidylyltransferase
LISAVVLAAGLSRRMGERKLLLVVDGKPILRWAIEGVMADVDDTIVVVGPDDRAIRDMLGNAAVRFVENPHPEEGQGTSIAAGIAALSKEADAALVVLGDQPWLPAGVVSALLDTFRRTRKAIIAPVYRGTQGTPVLFASSVFAELRALGGDAGAKRVVDADPARVARVLVDVTMPADVDTPEDLARLAAARGRRVQ